MPVLLSAATLAWFDIDALYELSFDDMQQIESGLTQVRVHLAEKFTREALLFTCELLNEQK